jgi:anti-sigma regulatory factor (Ser/Thr protein kinase)
MPLPIGLAISRYNLFDLGLDTRRLIGRVVYFGAAALVITVALLAGFSLLKLTAPGVDPLLLYMLCFGCMLIVEPLRSRMLGFLDAVLSPGSAKLRRLHERFAHDIAHVRDPDSIARELGESIRQGLSPGTGCVFLSSGDQWRLAYTLGHGFPAEGSLARQGKEALGKESLVHLSQLSGDIPPSQLPLVDAGIAGVAALEGGGQCYGIVLLGESASGSPYNGAEIGFVRAAAARAGSALHDLRLTGELLCAERHVTTARLALGLAHDIGKELDWLNRLAKRLPERVDDRGRLLRDMTMIQEFTEGLVQQVQDFVRDAADSSSDPPGVLRLGEIVESSVERMARIHGEGRVSHSVDPAIRSIRCHENLARAVTNVLDNALHASDLEDTVHVFATSTDDGVRITVTDRGCGMAASAIPAAFNPGFTTRGNEGGMGVGLPVSREIVESLGGRLELNPNPGGGMRATICLPAPC